MKGLAPLFLGIFGTLAFSWVGLTVIPNWQIGHLNPQSDEEGTDIYPMPQSGMVTRGARVYAANGCIYCHSQQVRAEYAGADIERKWGDRRSAPRDYIFERPVFLGKMRMGQDIANIGARAPAEQESPAPASSPATQGAAASPGASKPPTSPAPAAPPPSKSPATAAVAGASPSASPSAGPPWPEQTRGLPPMYSAAWHHVHLYSPRSINLDSNMPSYRFLYRARRITDARSTDSLKLTGSDAPPEGWEIIPTFDARCLIAYLMARNQSHPLKEVRSAAPAAGGSPVPSPAPGGQPAK
ncbi:MAG TPA: cbb3-type cytochrome c oxidase subunit II [Candidatus Dormibacteraeota bacterium]|jgi:cbb3-type cytochrome oxidase cytochrome c subunit|nr:cbb3-type cytochrome c oxidase subunit II [Candidatus Dormibacteraeota bacterium]